ncbi:uncharacterized protein N7473_012258 [Penicillium subrubescens]|uniref:uncharacterized protein n=1 Tax=Penicillium subrubescens TaxID=1316194 RepID=UPI002544DE2B|nr:uncharacterized protein N7473_012258 [Penicillium subrubescens]KAJ5881205.1 hypothetical protein N7473_012258 [Penicillium subrubescens]
MATPRVGVQVVEPPKAVLAFALAIVKNTPADTTVKEYILELRKSISGAEDTKPILTDQFFDSVRHWQNAYRKSELEQIKLHNTIFELKQKNEALLAKVKAETPPAKRKVFAEVENELEGGKKSGNPRSRNQPRHNNEGQGQDESRDSEPEKGVSFLRHLFTFQRTLQAKRRMTKALAIDAVILCKEAERGLLNAVQGEITSATQPPKTFPIPRRKEPEFKAVVNAVKQSFQLVYHVLHKTPEAADNGKSQPKVIYYMVCLFESTMTGLTQYCTAVSKETESVKATKGTTQVNRKQKKAAPPARGLTSARTDTARALAELLCEMALSLEINESCDRKVMEGYLHIVLERLGKMLALFTFDGMKLPTNTSAKMQPPEGLAAMKAEGISQKTAELEAKQLIHFLDRLLKTQTLFLSTSTISGPQAPFSLKLQESMKKTLLQAVFGKDDPLFQGGLERPATPPPTARYAPPMRNWTFPIGLQGSYGASLAGTF